MSYLLLLKRKRRRSKMWSSPLELYPVHVSPTQAPQGQVFVAEPQVAIKCQDYLSIQPTRGPYELAQDFYKRRLWVC